MRQCSVVVPPTSRMIRLVRRHSQCWFTRIPNMDRSGKLAFGRHVQQFRQALGMTQENLAEASGLDRSYVGGIERGERNPSLTVILNLAAALEIAPARLFEQNELSVLGSIGSMMATDTQAGLAIRFKYDRYDAEYLLPEATQDEFNEVINVLKHGLASGGKPSHTVVEAFMCAVQVWPHANPSDLWTFVISRAYCDRANHPDANARLNLEQSWKRTSGWALERVLVTHYRKVLMQKGIIIKSGTKNEKSALLGRIGSPAIIPDKADVLILYNSGDAEQLLGVIHVKASIAERRTDDVPMSQALINAGYLSVFWTMDCKSFPSASPVNRGEFGDSEIQQMSEKRRDIEEHGHFSACFSYNQNTIPTPNGSDAVAQIQNCGFREPDDHFSQFLIAALTHRLAQQPAY